MTTELYVIQKGLKVTHVRSVMKQRNISTVPVTDSPSNMRLCGIINIKDVMRAMEEDGLEELVNRYMTRNIATLEEDMPLSFAINYMEKYQHSCFPVLNKEKKLVGVVTSRDIVDHLLAEMNRELARLEQMLPSNETISNSKTMDLKYRCHHYDFENTGKASAQIKQILKQRGVSRAVIRRVAVAAYELEINLVIHALGGQIQFLVGPGQVEIVASDSGPGIADLELALREGYSTAGNWIRSLGFGAGMGLPNIRRVSDEFSIDSHCPESPPETNGSPNNPEPQKSQAPQTAQESQASQAGTVVRVKIFTDSADEPQSAIQADSQAAANDIGARQ